MSKFMVDYTYDDSEKHMRKTRLFWDGESIEEVLDFAATVTADALDSGAELVLEVTSTSDWPQADSWIQTVVVSHGEAHTLYKSDSGIGHRKIA